MVCTSTLYSYIDIQRLEIRNIDLTSKVAWRSKQHKTAQHKRVFGRIIDERPKYIAHRKQFGHWELDTIVGMRNGKESVLLTLIERKTRCVIIRIIDSRDADSVNYALKGIFAEYPGIFKTITADNVSEFSDISAVVGKETQICYAHPYTSSERETNEVHNKMARKIHGYRTPKELFEKEQRRLKIGIR